MYVCINTYLSILYLQYIEGNDEFFPSDRIAINAQITKFKKYLSNSCLSVRFAKLDRALENTVLFLSNNCCCFARSSL